MSNILVIKINGLCFSTCIYKIILELRDMVKREKGESNGKVIIAGIENVALRGCGSGPAISFVKIGSPWLIGKEYLTLAVLVRFFLPALG